jgi:hypothetical protein
MIPTKVTPAISISVAYVCRLCFIRHSPGSCIVPEPVWIGSPDIGGIAVMTEGRTQSGWRHTSPSRRSFERDKQNRAAMRGPFQSKIVIEQPH